MDIVRILDSVANLVIQLLVVIVLIVDNLDIQLLVVLVASVLILE